MTKEQFHTLRKGSVVEWVDGSIGLIYDRSDKHVQIVWENGMKFALSQLEAMALTFYQVAK